MNKTKRSLKSKYFLMELIFKNHLIIHFCYDSKTFKPKYQNSKILCTTLAPHVLHPIFIF